MILNWKFMLHNNRLLLLYIMQYLSELSPKSIFRCYFLDNNVASNQAVAQQTPNTF